MVLARASPPQERSHTPKLGGTGVARAGNSDIAFIEMHLACGSCLNSQLVLSRRCRIRRRPQFGDQPQDLEEKRFWHGDLATVADEFRTDLDQHLLQAGRRWAESARARAPAKNAWPPLSFSGEGGGPRLGEPNLLG